MKETERNLAITVAGAAHRVLVFSSHSSSNLPILTKARTRAPKAAVPRWKTAVV